MRCFYKNFAKFMRCMVVFILVFSGFSSTVHAEFIDSSHETDLHLTMNEPVSKLDVDKSENHSHHSNGGQECHSVSCNAYFASVHLQLYTPIHKIIVFSISTDQSVKSFSAFLYRPPKSIL